MYVVVATKLFNFLNNKILVDGVMCVRAGLSRKSKDNTPLQEILDEGGTSLTTK